MEEEWPGAQTLQAGEPGSQRPKPGLLRLWEPRRQPGSPVEQGAALLTRNPAGGAGPKPEPGPGAFLCWAAVQPIASRTLLAPRLSASRYSLSP